MTEQYLGTIEDIECYYHNIKDSICYTNSYKEYPLPPTGKTLPDLVDKKGNLKSVKVIWANTKDLNWFKQHIKFLGL